MSTQNTSGKAVGGNIRSGEAGHQGHDRQPSNDISKSGSAAPDASEAAKPQEVAARSNEATALQHKKGRTADIAHPGPERFEAERSKGDAHHDGNELEKDMQKKIENL
jgi:hypothetical protein